MGIAIISAPAAANSALSASAGSALPGEALLGEFAALLSGQLGLAASGEKSLGAALESSQAASDIDDAQAILNDGAIQLDPSLAFMVTPNIAPFPALPNSGPNLSEIDLDGNGKQSPLGMLIPSKGEAAKTKNEQTNLENGLAATSTASKPLVESTTANIAADFPSSLSLQQLAGNAPQANPMAHAAAANHTHETRTAIDTPMRDSQWGQNFGEKIVWLAKNDQATAQITLNPPQLGPMQVSLQLNGDQANAIFASPNAEVRQAIQDSLPQLKEMLAAAGINLGQADIGANMAKQNREMPFQSANGQRSLDENAILAGSGNMADSTSTTPIQRGRGMVDLFA